MPPRRTRSMARSIRRAANTTCSSSMWWSRSRPRPCSRVPRSDSSCVAGAEIGCSRESGRAISRPAMFPRPPKKFVPTPFEYHQEIEITIDSLTNLGSGVGRIDGWVVFVPFSLPGEVVKARVFRNDKNCSHADLVEVLTPSPDRIEPCCPLFGECGGCQYQHLSYDKQLAWKTRQVGELMKHMA